MIELSDVTSRQALTIAIRVVIACATPEQKRCKHFGADLARAVERIQFWDAEPWEPRGLSDTGLREPEIVALAAFELPAHFGDLVWMYVDFALDDVG